MTIDFMDAVFGKETEIQIPKDETCDTCDGAGAKKGTSPETCSHCGGTGEISVTQDTPFVRMINRSACHHSDCTGQYIPSKYSTCKGKRNVRFNTPMQLT